ncbi:MAG: hypothetical protein Q8O63_04260, partial [Hoeflea sp.]|nr:hypothetical protein [Hoeflea sp.]
MSEPVLKSRGTYVFCRIVATAFVTTAMRLFDTCAEQPEDRTDMAEGPEHMLVIIPARMASARL